MSADPDRPLVKADAIEEVDLAGEVVLFRHGHLHRLNPTGSVVWQLLEPAPTIHELVRAVASHFEHPAEAIHARIATLTADLVRHGLLVGDDGHVRSLPARPPAPDTPYVGPGDPPPVLDPEDRQIAHRTGRFVALGFDFAVHCTDATIGRFLSDAFAGLAAEGSADHVYVLAELHGGTWAVLLDDVGLTTSASAEAAVRHVVWHVNSEAMRLAGDHLLVHGAGAVSDGRMVLLPGEMNAGKTTLVGGLVLDGFEYVTDELLAFDAEGLVHPYPRPMNIGRGSWDALASLEPRWAGPLTQQWFLNPLAIRGAVLAAPSVPHAIVAPRYTAGADDELVPMSEAETLELLHAQTMNPQPLDAKTFHALAALVQAVPCRRLNFSRLPEAVALVRSLLEELDAE